MQGCSCPTQPKLLTREMPVPVNAPQDATPSLWLVPSACARLPGICSTTVCSDPLPWNELVRCFPRVTEEREP